MIMLVLTRRIGEEIVIGGDVRVKVVLVKGDRVRLAYGQSIQPSLKTGNERAFGLLGARILGPTPPAGPTGASERWGKTVPGAGNQRTH
jgi:hypothetical protein